MARPPRARLSALLGERLTKRKLGGAVPIAGIAIGAGFNKLAVSRVADTANFLYRDRFLRGKYDPPDPPDPPDEHTEDDADAEELDDDIALAEIVADELDPEEASPAGDEFRLEFDPPELEALASRYSYSDDAAVVSAGAAAATRGYYTRDELVLVCSSKTPRSKPLVAGIPPLDAQSAADRALGATDERERLEALLDLPGVVCHSVGSAARRLTRAVPDPRRLGPRVAGCPRTLDVLGGVLAALPRCLPIACGDRRVGRTLDKALWRLSKERTPRQ